MTVDLTAPPTLSTPAEHLFEHVQPEVAPSESESQVNRRSHDELRDIYEIANTAQEIRAAKRRRVALQFPDSMLGDAPWVVEALKSELAESSSEQGREADDGYRLERIYILADTSYSSCCVDEIAAEHADADAVVHYGRSCLSPTSRLPVIYVFTKHQLDEELALQAFEKDFSDKESRVIVMADVTYQDHVPRLVSSLRVRGYCQLLSTSITHNPMGRIPNRVVLGSDDEPVPDDLDLRDYSVFHVSTPPTALLLALSSRVQSLHILPTGTGADSATSSATVSSGQTAMRLLGRRYARLLSLASAGIIGILVNTLSVSNYLSSIDNIRKQIAAAGKKSYTVVVGKLNPAKLANFAEVDGWVVIGCWESSLVEDDAGFFQPVITPFELDAALAGDDKRVWGGDWWGGIEGVKEFVPEEKDTKHAGDAEVGYNTDDEEESAPPEFDLRTGKLVYHSRPMRVASAASTAAQAKNTAPQTAALTLRPKAELATVNGVVSPGAEFLRSQRTWAGLGGDYDTSAKSAAIEEGRSGLARGYTVGSDDSRT
jgi:diphthamide biosynthesis protein 2